MSHSYRRHPIVIQEEKDTKAGNRKVRHSKLAEIPSGGAFKKFGVGWPCVYYYSWAEAEKDYFKTPRLQQMYTYEEWKHYYLSTCVRK